MVNLEVFLLVFWMELSWAIKKRLFLIYLSIPLFFFLVSYSVQVTKTTPYPSSFLANGLLFSLLFSSYLISFGFVQKGKSFWNLAKLAGSLPIYIFLGELLFSILIAVIQAIVFFFLALLFSGVGNLANFVVLLIFSFLFSLLYTTLFLLLSLPLKFKPHEFLCLSSSFLLLSLCFSNAFFPLDSLPTPLRILSFFNPLTYGVNGFHLALGTKDSFVFSNPGVISGLYLVFSIISLYILAKSSAKA